MRIEELQDKADKLGYRVFLDGPKIERVVPVVAHTPRITNYSTFRNEGWSIDVEGFGTLSPDAVASLVEGYNRAIDMVSILNAYEGN